MVAPWVRRLTEEVMGGAPVEIGKRYQHPTDGEIEIVSGQYWGSHGLSNFWHWRVIETGEIKSGYGGEWPVTERPPSQPEGPDPLVYGLSPAPPSAWAEISEEYAEIKCREEQS